MIRLSKYLSALALLPALVSPVQPAAAAGNSSYRIYVTNQINRSQGTYCFTLSHSNPIPSVTSGSWTAGPNTGGIYTITPGRKLHLFGAWSGQFFDFTATVDVGGKLSATSYLVATVSDSLPLAVGVFRAERVGAC